MDQLGFNIPVLLAQIINFGIVLGILYAFAYKPILKMLNERSERIREGLEAAEQARINAAEADKQVQARLEEARGEGQALVAQAQNVANRIQEEARVSARAEGEALVARARGEIQLERDNALAELRREFADLTMRTAEKVINTSLDRKAHERLIDEALAEMTPREG